jgi:hypothetical protein
MIRIGPRVDRDGVDGNPLSERLRQFGRFPAGIRGESLYNSPLNTLKNISGAPSIEITMIQGSNQGGNASSEPRILALILEQRRLLGCLG